MLLFWGTVSVCGACVVAEEESQADLEESVVLLKAKVRGRILQKLHKRGIWDQRGILDNWQVVWFL